MLSSFRHRLFFCICILHMIQCITYEKYRKVKKSLQKSNPIRTGGQNGKLKTTGLNCHPICNPYVKFQGNLEFFIITLITFLIT